MLLPSEAWGAWEQVAGVVLWVAEVSASALLWLTWGEGLRSLAVSGDGCSPRDSLLEALCEKQLWSQAVPKIGVLLKCSYRPFFNRKGFSDENWNLAEPKICFSTLTGAQMVFKFLNTIAVKYHWWSRLKAA